MNKNVLYGHRALLLAGVLASTTAAVFSWFSMSRGEAAFLTGLGLFNVAVSVKIWLWGDKIYRETLVITERLEKLRRQAEALLNRTQN
jgi:hypothetical protein